MKEKCLLLVRKLKALKWWRDFKRERASWVKDTLAEYGDSTEFQTELTYLKKHGADYFPYPWSAKKQIMQIKGGGGLERSGGTPYVIHHGKKLYMDLRAYSQLLLEQHEYSPHRYFTESFCVREGDVFVDLGAAEGMISLEVVEKASKVILVECDPVWLEKLERTFLPWKEKVQIISKYASDHDDERNVSLDTLLKDEQRPVFIKMDVEGMEEIILAGGSNVLKRPETRAAVCTYHRPEDAGKLKSYFENLGCRTEFSEGYMAMVNSDDKPRFRKAMLRVWRE